MLAIVTIPWQNKTNVNKYEAALHGAYNVFALGNHDLAVATHGKNGPSSFASLYDGERLRIGILCNDLIRCLMDSSVASRCEFIAHDSFDSLLEKASDDPRIDMRFLTPLALGRIKSFTLFPDPQNVFGSLINKWRVFGGPEVPDLRYNEASLVHGDLRMTKVVMSQYIRRGWLGSVGYIVPKDVARWYNALCLFAQYSGVGRKVTHGFGQIRLN